MATLYSPLKYLSYADHLAAIRERRVVAPVHIRIKPTNRCNHNCWYCAYRADGLQLGEGMREADQIPEAKMMEIVDDLIAMGVKAVTFSGGGEPLLYKPLPAVIDRLAEGGIRVATLTNGSNLKGRVGEALARHATWVRISVDAWDDASYAASRGAHIGAFSQLLTNVRDFKATGTKAVLGVSLIVSKDNAARISEICGLFKEAGAGHVKLSAAVVANDAAANNRYHREFKETVDRQISQAAGLNDAGFSVVDHYHEMSERFEKAYDFCPYLMFLTVIGADQRVYTCQDKAYTAAGDMGSIEHRSFRDLWFSEEHRERLHGFDPRENCGHHCVTHSKNLSILEYLSIDPDHAVFV
jgi:MoaA/NifB/PqqE/SkfB family radical SAM enzyme